MSDKFDVLDMTNAVKAVCATLAELELSSGKPLQIYEGILSVPLIDNSDDLPIAVVDTEDEMKISESDDLPAMQIKLEVPITVWYIFSNPLNTDVSDILRLNGKNIAKAFWGVSLDWLGTDTIDYVKVNSIDWSNSNAVNFTAIENDLPFVGVSVSMTLEKYISRRLVD